MAVNLTNLSSTNSDIVEGGELVLEMTDAPTNWGVK